MRRLLPLILLLTACALPGTGLQDGPGITGTYIVNGVDPLGTEYSGIVTIGSAGDRSRFTIEWVITGAVQAGTGSLDGDRLSVEWHTVSSPRGDSTGRATYTLTNDGRLVGTRSVDGLEGSGTEEIFPEP